MKHRILEGGTPMRSSKWLLLTVLTMLLSIIITPRTPVLAQPNPDSGVPGGPFSTAFRVQNLGASNATCTYQVFNATGSQVFDNLLPTIAVGASAYVFTPSVSGFPSGVFAATISCDQPVAAVVNYSDSNSGDTFVGISSPATKLYVPGVYDNYYNYYTSLRIMNAGSGSNNVTIKYYDGTTQVVSETFALNTNGSRAVTHEGRTGFANNKIYSAVIEGSGPLAAIVQIYGRGPVEDQLYAYTAFSSGSTKAYVPLSMSNYYGYDTAVSVQNVGNNPTKVRITYSNGLTQTVNLASGQSHTWLDFNLLPASSNTYSAVVESGVDGSSSQPIIVTVNESRRGQKLATTYEGFTSGATQLVAPVVMKSYYGYQSSITCQNIGNAPANISVGYKGEAGTSPVTVPITQKVSNLAVNQSAVILQQLETALPAGFIGSAQIQSDRNIICVVNQSNQGLGATQDQLYAYNALVQP